MGRMKATDLLYEHIMGNREAYMPNTFE